jgi:hypothetical protein
MRRGGSGRRWREHKTRHLTPKRPYSIIDGLGKLFIATGDHQELAAYTGVSYLGGDDTNPRSL